MKINELNTREMPSKNEKMKCRKKDGARSWAYRGGHEDCRSKAKAWRRLVGVG